MKNVQLYQDGLLTKLLKTASSVPEINDYLKEELNYCKKNIPEHSYVIDFGCGNGRHLIEIIKTISSGLGIDINENYLNEARKNNKSDRLEFKKGNIECFKSAQLFDVAISLYNTLGNIDHPEKAVQSMLSSIKSNGKIIISLFSEKSIPFRVKMYKNMGLQNPRLVADRVITDEGFSSKHYTKQSIKKLLPMFTVIKCTEIGWIAEYKKS